MFKESYLHDYDLIKKKISNTTQDDLFQKQLPPPPLDELSTELLKSKVMSLGLDYYIVDSLSRETLIEILDETLGKHGVKDDATSCGSSKVSYDPQRMDAWLEGLKLGLNRKTKRIQRKLLKETLPTSSSRNNETSTESVGNKLVIMSAIFLALYLSFLGVIYYLFI